MVVSRKKILIYYTQFSEQIGGSEILALRLLEALSPYHDVTLLTRKVVDWNLQNAHYGTSVNPALFQTHLCSPRNFITRFLDRVLYYYEARIILREGPKYDVCISCSNMVDFGIPGIHFIYLMNFDPKFEDSLSSPPVRRSQLPFWHKIIRNFLDHSIRPFFVKPRNVETILRDQKERVFPNSLYVKKEIEKYYSCKISEVFYPPTVLKSSFTCCKRKILEVICLGRISPEKKQERIIGIVNLARKKSGLDIKIYIAGTLEESSYSQHIKHLAELHPWVVLEGALYGTAKKNFLEEHAIAIHANELETFGISITEYITSGIVPIVPAHGGAAEIVGISELIYRTEEEGAGILIKLLTNSDFMLVMQKKLRQRAQYYSAGAYDARQKELLKNLGLL